jgi:hypothetical protein
LLFFLWKLKNDAWSNCSRLVSDYDLPEGCEVLLELKAASLIKLKNHDSCVSWAEEHWLLLDNLSCLRAHQGLELRYLPWDLAEVRVNDHSMTSRDFLRKLKELDETSKTRHIFDRELLIAYHISWRDHWWVELSIKFDP